MRRFEVVSDEFRIFPDSNIILPTRATIGSAGYDFITPVEIKLQPNEFIKVATDVKVKIPEYEVLNLYLRSSIGINLNVMLSNSVGIIDSDYYNNLDNDGNIIVALYNYGQRTIKIPKGNKLAQGIFMSYQTIDNENESELLKTRHGGIGSTGK